MASEASEAIVLFDHDGGKDGIMTVTWGISSLDIPLRYAVQDVAMSMVAMASDATAGAHGATVETETDSRDIPNWGWSS